VVHGVEAFILEFSPPNDLGTVWNQALAGHTQTHITLEDWLDNNISAEEVVAQMGSVRPDLVAAKQAIASRLTDAGWGTDITELKLTEHYSGIYYRTNGVDNLWPRWSPDGQQLAFGSTRAGNSDIYVIDVDGGHMTQLTRDPVAALYFIHSPEDVQPVWSPDGRRLAFSSGRDNALMTRVTYSIYVMDTDGSHVERLSQCCITSEVRDWSPDTQQILFTAQLGDSSLEAWWWDVFVMNANGTNLSRLTHTEAMELYAVWSPDGRRIAFDVLEDGNADLFVMNADGSGVTRLTSTPTNETQPTWSPDGQHIAYVSDAGDNPDVYIMNADGTNPQRLTDNAAYDMQPAWSPDGQRLAFVSTRGGQADIYVMNIDGTIVVQLTRRN
jgi:TolB protein